MLEQYFSTEDDRTVLRAEVHDKFFSDLHETLREAFFNGGSTRYEEVEGEETAEILLPEPDELMAYVQLVLREKYVIVTTMLPAQRLQTGTEGLWQEILQYEPPNLHEA